MANARLKSPIRTYTLWRSINRFKNRLAMVHATHHDLPKKLIPISGVTLRTVANEKARAPPVLPFRL